jgi:hypothetical protein
LFEVVLSLGIFAMSAAAIAQLISNGLRGAVHAQLQTQAVIRCEGKLSEIVAGVTSMSSVGESPFPDDPAWSWSAAIKPGPHQDLYLVEVTVLHPGSGQMSELSYSLARLVRDPNVTSLMQQQNATQQQQQIQASQSGTTAPSSGGSR